MPKTSKKGAIAVPDPARAKSLGRKRGAAEERIFFPDDDSIPFTLSGKTQGLGESVKRDFLTLDTLPEVTLLGFGVIQG